MLLQLKEKSEFLNSQVDMLWQAVHQKGLEVGMPNIILNDMTEAMSIIDSAVGLWDDNKTMEQEALQDVQINKYRDTGDLITAESMRYSQVLRLRENRISVKTFIVSMREALRRIQKRMQ